MTSRHVSIAIVCLLTLGSGANAADGAAADDSAGLELFERRIRPLLAEHCYKCHGPKKQENGLRLDRVEGLRAGGDGGPAIIEGKPDESLLIGAVRYEEDDLQMPPDGKLSDGQIADLVRWVEMGAPLPDAPPADAKDKTNNPAKPNDGKTARQATSDHWAFQKVRRPRLPKVNHRDWPRSPIDYFILAKLEAAGIEPAAPADRRTLARRTSLDLVGLPPSVQQVHDLVADDSPDAVARYVERLLSSPEYGERWGRHWLDVARYADSNGLDENLAHGTAWRYRDWVIAAFNSDKPYDEFLREQLAGDLLPADDPKRRNEQLIATGFLALGPKVLAEVDERKMEMDIVDEQIDTVGKALLGLTLGCARCHDHKFDPITAEDYYALAGIFQSTRTMDSFTKIAQWHENPLYSEQHERARQRHGEKLARKRRQLDAQVATATAALQERLGQSAALPAKPEEQFSKETREQLARLRSQVADLEKSVPQPPTAMGVTEGQARDTAVHVRGSHLLLGKKVPRGVPAVLAGAHPIAIDARHSGRRELAEWITAKDHPLTARVMVNRIWRWHFGRGLVATTDNFGLKGELPAHGELLDYLAAELVASGWSIKHVQRLIINSATYQAGHRPSEAAGRLDPANRLYSHWNVRRLDAEALRDSLLAVGGVLEKSIGGSQLATENRKHIFDHTSKDDTTYASHRRSVYLPVVRNHLADAFTLFDYADASVPQGNRNTSTVATQALYLMNSQLPWDAAGHLAERVLASGEDDESCLQTLWELAYSRPATEDEVRMAKDFLQDAELARVEKTADHGDQAASQAKGNTGHRAWQLLCQTVLLANEFVYIK